MGLVPLEGGEAVMRAMREVAAVATEQEAADHVVVVAVVVEVFPHSRRVLLLTEGTAWEKGKTALCAFVGPTRVSGEE